MALPRYPDRMVCDTIYRFVLSEYLVPWTYYHFFPFFWKICIYIRTTEIQSLFHCALKQEKGKYCGSMEHERVEEPNNAARGDKNAGVIDDTLYADCVTEFNCTRQILWISLYQPALSLIPVLSL